MSALLLIGRVIVLTIILFVCYGVAGTVVGLGGAQAETSGGTYTALILLISCLLQVLVLTHLIIRSRWSGWRLAAAVCFVFYGVMTFMAQIESLVFLTRLPPGTVPRLFLMGIIIAVPFSLAAIVVLGKRKAGSEASEPYQRLVMPAREWTWKLAVIGVAYVALYFTFGYFVAWRNPALREYYGGAEGGTFLLQMQNVINDTPWLVPFQFARAMCWVVIALPVIKMLRGDRRETALSLGFLFSILMIAPLLLPNPYMPETVRMSHVFEIGPSNFILGLLVGCLLTEHRSFHGIAAPQGVSL